MPYAISHLRETRHTTNSSPAVGSSGWFGPVRSDRRRTVCVVLHAS